MKISVIIPFYNVQQYFEQCIYSLINQTFSAMECIFIDDGSTDESLKILKDKIKGKKNCKIIEQKNAGQSAARKAGFEAATGEYIAFLDADDWVELDFYEKLYKKAQEGNYDIVFSNTIFYQNNIYKKKNFISNQTYKNFKERNIYKKYSKFIDISVLWNRLYKKELFKDEINYFPNIRKFEDNYFNFAIALSKPSIGYCFDTNIYYRIRENSVMTSIQSVDNCFEFLKDNVNEIDYLVNTYNFTDDVRDIYFKIADVYKLKIILAWYGKLKDKQNIEFATNVLKDVYSKKNSYIDFKTRKKLEKRLNLNFLKRLFYIDKAKQGRIIFQIFGLKIKKKTQEAREKILIEQLMHDNENIILNTENLKLVSENKKNNILIISDYFLEKGGMETRIEQYLEFLNKQGWGIYILSEYNKNKELLKYNNFYLKYDALNLSKNVLDLIKKYKINLVEFHFASSNYLSNIDIKELKKYSKVGSVIHNKGVINQKIINKFDYNIIVSFWLKNMFYKNIKKAYIIPNAIKNQNIKWEYLGQKKAILISRIDKEKLPTIEAFIGFCKDNNFEFEIAGEENLTDNIIFYLTKKYNLSSKNFIGLVDTIPYLIENLDKYLFVGGVGLVLLEAASLGYPCFCCSHLGKEYSSFITNDNIDKFVFNNFTIKEGNARDVLKNRVIELLFENIDIYDLSSYIEKNNNLNKTLNEYKVLINSL